MLLVVLRLESSLGKHPESLIAENSNIIRDGEKNVITNSAMEKTRLLAPSISQPTFDK